MSGRKPLLRTRDTYNYTGASFNQDLRKLLGEEAARSGGTISSHSFRSGLNEL